MDKILESIEEHIKNEFEERNNISVIRVSHIGFNEWMIDAEDGNTYLMH